MKFGERLKLSSNISNIYLIVGTPKPLRVTGLGRKKYCHFNYYGYIAVRSVAKEISCA